MYTISVFTHYQWVLEVLTSKTLKLASWGSIALEKQTTEKYPASAEM